MNHCGRQKYTKRNFLFAETSQLSFKVQMLMICRKSKTRSRHCCCDITNKRFLLTEVKSVFICYFTDNLHLFNFLNSTCTPCLWMYMVCCMRYDIRQIDIWRIMGYLGNNWKVNHRYTCTCENKCAWTFVIRGFGFLLYAVL